MAQRPKSRAVGTEKRTPKKRPAAEEAVLKTRAGAKASTAKKAAKPTAAPKAAAKKVVAKKVVAKKALTKKAVAKKASGSKPAKKIVRPKSAVQAAKVGAKAVARVPQRKTSKLVVSAKPAGKKTIRVKSPKAVATRAKPAAKALVKAAKAASSKAAVGKASGRKPGTPKKTRVKQRQPYLAAELGQPVDHDGEPIGAGSPRAQSDRELQEYALQLWRQMQSGSVTKRYMRSIERAGLTVDDIWVSGVRDTWPTSSTPDEMRRYRQKALFRANLLEAILSETVGDLRRLEGIEPTPPQTAGESAGEPG